MERLRPLSSRRVVTNNVRGATWSIVCRSCVMYSILVLFW